MLIRSASKNIFLGLASLSISFAPVLANADQPESAQALLNLSLEDLLKVRVGIISNKPKSLSNQPAAVSVITESEIQESGARYLSDLLSQVPSFWTGTDTIGTFSVSFRGVWGMEAKVLLIIDGIEQNELAFGSLVLGKRYPASLIKQVEIIRGPGSSRYGGQAELAVIKVTTKATDNNEASIAITSDFDSEGQYNNTLSFSTALDASGDFSHSIAAAFGTGDYGNDLWTGLDGYAFNLKDNSNSESLQIGYNLKFKDLDFRVFYDRFIQEDRLLFGDSGLFIPPFARYTEPNELSFENLNIAASYQWQLSDKLELESKLTWTQQKPWNSDSQYSQKLRRIVNRLRLDSLLNYRFSDDANILIGASYYDEEMKVTESHLFDPSTRFDGSNTASLNDYSVFFSMS